MDAITYVLIALALAAAVPMAHYGIQALRTKCDSLKLGKWNQILDQVFDAADTAVTKFQPTVDNWKAENRSGKLTGDQVQSLKDDTVAYVQAVLKPAGIDVLHHVSEETIGDWVTHIVEARKNTAFADPFSTEPTTKTPVPPAAATPAPA